VREEVLAELAHAAEGQGGVLDHGQAGLLLDLVAGLLVVEQDREAVVHRSLADLLDAHAQKLVDEGALARGVVADQKDEGLALDVLVQALGAIARALRHRVQRALDDLLGFLDDPRAVLQHPGLALVKSLSGRLHRGAGEGRFRHDLSPRCFRVRWSMQAGPAAHAVLRSPIVGWSAEASTLVRWPGTTDLMNTPLHETCPGDQALWVPIPGAVPQVQDLAGQAFAGPDAFAQRLEIAGLGRGFGALAHEALLGDVHELGGKLDQRLPAHGRLQADGA